MLVTNHVLAGAVVGAVAGRRPAVAFGLGVVSHFVLDATPHWGRWKESPTFMQVAVPDGLVGLVAMAAMTALAPPDTRLTVFMGMAGAALPDLDKPSKVFFGRSPFPRPWDLFHERIQDEAPDRFKHELVAAALFSTAAVSILAVRRRVLARHLIAVEFAVEGRHVLLEAGDLRV